MDGGKTPQGEVGILRDVRYYPYINDRRMFLIMHHRGADYIGCLLFDDRSFCSEIVSLLPHYYGMTIEAIGSSDLPASGNLFL
jgi:hypothetical protein